MSARASDRAPQPMPMVSVCASARARQAIGDHRPWQPAGKASASEDWAGHRTLGDAVVGEVREVVGDVARVGHGRHAQHALSVEPDVVSRVEQHPYPAAPHGRGTSAAGGSTMWLDKRGTSAAVNVWGGCSWHASSGQAVVRRSSVGQASRRWPGGQALVRRWRWSGGTASRTCALHG
jgi:hypothetical protein